MPKFSICTPVTYDRDDPDNKQRPRYEMFIRCAKSVSNQSFEDFEWVIADDKCNPSVESLLLDQEVWGEEKDFDVDYQIVKLPEKQGRIYARNAAMKVSTGDWICWLDADDEYATFYLEALNDAIRVYPDYKLFNFNHLIFDHEYTTHIKKFIDMDIQKDKPFPSGTIGAGAFIFHRSVFEDIGCIPEKGLWELRDWAFENYPELKPFYWNEANQDYNSLGNPWGEDFLYFYMLTRKYESKYLDFAPYFVHSHWGHKWIEDPEYKKDQGKAPEFNVNNI